MTLEKVNITELAHKAGMSISTISRAINPETRGKVAAKTLKRIDYLLEKYSFTPNLAAKSLRKSSTKTIGLVFPYLPGIFYSPYYHHILAGVTDFLKDTEYQFKMLLLSENQKKWDHYDFKIGERVDGLIIIHWFKYFSKISILENLGIPCAIINDLQENNRVRFFGVDHVVGGQIAANCLYTAGHRNIAILAGPDWSKDSQQRISGFLDFLKKVGIRVNPEFILTADFLETRAYEKIDSLFKKNSSITALFCCNDQMAYGAIRRLKELGISCPSDISVVGFDDDPWSATLHPPLTTIQVPVYELAKSAVQGLMGDLQSEDPKTLPARRPVLLPVRLIERHSVKKIS